jgi:uncharacterized delta-60 repeat protein
MFYLNYFPLIEEFRSCLAKRDRIRVEQCRSRAMLSLSPSTHVASLTSWARATVRARNAALFLFSVAMLLAGGTSAVRGQSALDGFDPNANGKVYVIVVQVDGKILLGGAFTTLAPNGGAAVMRNHIARLNPDGTLDSAFNPNANDTISAIAVQADGKILVGGSFASIGGQTRDHIARLDSTTGLADSFNPNANDNISAIAVQADGKILASGSFTNIGGQARNRIARLDPSTGQADSFDPNANRTVISIVVQPDGKILAAGSFTEIGGQIRNGLARLNPVTGLADSFNPNAKNNLLSGVVQTIAVQADGKILAAGNFVEIGGQPRFYIARLDPATGLADSFNPEASSFVEAIAVQADGRILVGGIFTNIGGRVRRYIARLDSTTGQADSFDPHADDFVTAIAVQADGKVLAAGWFTALAPNDGETVTRNHIARLETDGRVDQTLDLAIVGDATPASPAVFATAILADGKTLIGGNFTSVLGVPRNHIARLNRDGTLDTAFDPNADHVVYAIATQEDGKILVGGAFTSIGGQIRFHMARLDPLTGLPDSFDPNANDDVLCMAVQVYDRRILVGGKFTTIGGQMRNRIARLEPFAGTADQFNPDANGTVRSIGPPKEYEHGYLTVMVGGAFTNIGGQMRNHIAELQSWSSGPGFLTGFIADVQGEDVYAIVPQANGQVLVGGPFTGIGGQPRNNIARINYDGTADSFDPNANSSVSSIVLQADGKILVGGAFNGANSIGGQARNRVARLDPDTGRADSFDPNANDTVYSLALQSDGKILAGGLFTSIGGEPRNAFARLSNDTAALQELSATQTRITWTLGGSSPQFARVFFSYSTDNLNYTPLGEGFIYEGSGGSWLGGNAYLSPFPAEQNIHIQARGHYRGGYFNSSECISDSARNVFLLPGARPRNLSTRMQVGTGDNVGIGGFIIKQNDFLVFDSKHVLLRAVGASFDQLVDPVLELHRPDPYETVINDNWRDDPLQAKAILATGLAPSRDLDSAIDAYLPPGSYTAVVRGKNNSSGVGLVEIYDLDQPVPTKLANISTRALVGTNSNILIAGFILGGNGANDRIVVRGLGPSLTAFGVPGALANPKLELRDQNAALLIANNDWQDNPAQAAELTAAGFAPRNPLEAAAAMTLPPGSYTTLVFGENNGTGVGLVEVYDRGAP